MIDLSSYGKECSVCSEYKSLEQFPSRTRRNLAPARCLACAASVQRMQRSRKWPDVLEGARNWKRDNPEKVKDYNRRYLQNNRIYFLIKEIEVRARSRDIVFDLWGERARFEAQYLLGCEMTGIAFDDSYGGPHYNSASIDRVDRGKGYTPDNTRLVLWCMNAAMNQWGENRLREVMTIWLAKRKD